METHQTQALDIGRRASTAAPRVWRRRRNVAASMCDNLAPEGLLQPGDETAVTPVAVIDDKIDRSLAIARR